MFYVKYFITGSHIVIQTKKVNFFFKNINITSEITFLNHIQYYFYLCAQLI